MKAVVCHGEKDYRVEEVEKPKAGPGEVVVAVKACGICAGDVKAYKGGDMFWEGSAVTAPVIPGHEFYGEVVELGEGASEKFNLEIGDLATADQIVPCGKCKFCQEGDYWMCKESNIYGFQKDIAEGGMAEYMKFYKTSKVHKIPDSLTLEEASLIEPMACAVHAVQRGDIRFEDTVVLSGAGPLGLCMVQLIALKNPKNIIVLDLDESRLEKANKLGANYCFNPKNEDVVKKVKDLTDGNGCDVYIEAVGVEASVRQGLDMIRRLGRFVEFGLFTEDASANWSIIGDGKELDIRGAHLSPYSYPIAIDLFEKNLVSAEEIISEIYDIEDFDLAMERAMSLETIKVLIKP